MPKSPGPRSPDSTSAPSRASRPGRSPMRCPRCPRAAPGPGRLPAWPGRADVRLPAGAGDGWCQVPRGKGAGTGYPLPPLSSGIPAPRAGETGRRSWPCRSKRVSPSPGAWASQHRHCWELGGAVPSLLLSSPSDAAQGQQAPHEQEGLVPTDAKARGWHDAGSRHWPRAHLAPAPAGGFMWIPNGVAPRVGAGAVL